MSNATRGLIWALTWCMLMSQPLKEPCVAAREHLQTASDVLCHTQALPGSRTEPWTQWLIRSQLWTCSSSLLGSVCKTRPSDPELPAMASGMENRSENVQGEEWWKIQSPSWTICPKAWIICFKMRLMVIIKQEQNERQMAPVKVGLSHWCTSPEGFIQRYNGIKLH